MKRCPTCDQTFEDDRLMFCTRDGTSLVDYQLSRNQAPPAIKSSAPPELQALPNWNQPTPPPPVTPPAPQPNWNQPLDGLASGRSPELQPGQPAWQPSPPPAYAAGPTQAMAVTSLICGIFSVTLGWCCYAGVAAAPVAIGLGFYQLSQIKKFPDKFAGKPLAITGIVTGFAYFALLALLIFIYGAAIFVQLLGNR